MRTMITIGELAKLMHLSTHQIRYFEEKGILFPDLIDHNGYRLYDLKAVYTLSHILLLRKLNISVSDIKLCLEQYQKRDYIKLLEDKLAEVDDVIQTQIKLKAYIEYILSTIKNNNPLEDDYYIHTFKTRYLKQIYQMGYKDVFSMKHFYNQCKDKFKLHETDLINLYDDNAVYICIEQEEQTSDVDYILQKGTYLCHSFFITEQEGMKKAIDDYLKYAHFNQIKIKGHLIVKEQSIFSIADNQALYYTLQAKIENETSVINKVI